MKRRKFINTTGFAAAGLLVAQGQAFARHIPDSKPIPIGMIGLDTSHSPAFSKIINAPGEDEALMGFRVSHAYPHGSKDIESSVSRIPRYTQEMKDLGVKIVDSIPELLDQVEAVLLETNDGRLHLGQAKLVFEAGKPVFIDKPIAASLADAIEIFALAQQHKVPMFSASSLRFGPKTVAVREGSIGKILGADTYSPAKLEATHPDLFWYGIHGVESLFTVMGTGCISVQRMFQDGMDVVVGEWEDGRIGTFRGLRNGKTGYGGVAFGEKGIAEVGAYEGYKHLVAEILQFFRTGISPIPPKETIEIFAFMAAAEESKRQGGGKVSLSSVIEKAKAQ